VGDVFWHPHTPNRTTSRQHADARLIQLHMKPSLMMHFNFVSFMLSKLPMRSKSFVLHAMLPGDVR
jgi:hypothetical protein